METIAKREITLQLLGRNLSVVATTEEAGHLRDAVAVIEQKVATYRAAYEITDEAYLLLMCSLELATESAATRRDWARRSQQLDDRFQTLDSLLLRTLTQLDPQG
jgi:cell division protein ZapA (FtsZ GTPase activity inhibitor)